ncbi:MAG: nucleotidyltransferase family protein [Sphingobium sp.]
MSGATLIAILAAGRASRFGGGKLDAPCAGKPLGNWAIEAVDAAGAPPGLIVVGPDAPSFTGIAMADGWALVTNPEPEAGIGGSVALAARHAECLGADALVLLLADMPLIDGAFIRQLLDGGSRDMPVAARYPSGKPGVPARFPAAMFADLSALSGDRGAAMLLAGRTGLLMIDPPAGSLLDVDDKEALARAESALRQRPIG